MAAGVQAEGQFIRSREKEQLCLHRNKPDNSTLYEEKKHSTRKSPDKSWLATPEGHGSSSLVHTCRPKGYTFHLSSNLAIFNSKKEYVTIYKLISTTSTFSQSSLIFRLGLISSWLHNDIRIPYYSIPSLPHQNLPFCLLFETFNILYSNLSPQIFFY